MGYNKSSSAGVPQQAPDVLNLDAKTAAVTLGKEDNGKVIDLAGTGVAITLPAVADIDSGWHIKALVTDTISTTDFTVVAQTNVIQGHAVVNGATVAAANENTIHFVAGTAVAGDYVDLIFDGINFFVSGSGGAAGAITFTAP